MAKQDRCFTSIEWINIYPLTTLSTAVRLTSDHIPLLLRFTAQSQVFEYMIDECWDTRPTPPDSVAAIVLKLRFLGAKLRSWNHSNVGNIIVQKTDLLQSIDSLEKDEEKRNLTISETEERSALKEKLEMLLTQEEMLWEQRTRAQWLNNGDRHTKFFHIWASNRRRKILF
ncbi:uncharacterized protein [Elaeis guineensis]|uniref:uncharacterized protein n=1 Tax=Elaeis guineensis var. tenera TaxID=51953 RepID=UPI003C6D2F3C